MLSSAEGRMSGWLARLTDLTVGANALDSTGARVAWLSRERLSLWAWTTERLVSIACNASSVAFEASGDRVVVVDPFRGARTYDGDLRLLGSAPEAHASRVVWPAERPPIAVETCEAEFLPAPATTTFDGLGLDVAHLPGRTAWVDPRGMRAVTCDYATLEAWDLAPVRRRWTRACDGRVHHVSLTAGGDDVAVRVQVADEYRSSLLSWTTGLPRACAALETSGWFELSPVGELAAHCHGEAPLSIVELRSGRILRSFDEETATLDVKWSGDGRRIALVDFAMRLRVYDVG